MSLTDLLFSRYSFIAKDLLALQLDGLVAVRAHFGGDLDRFVIFLLVALRTAQDPRTAAIDPLAVRRGEVSRYPSLLTNVRSIAASTDIPYETVRRKVTHLMDSGWIERIDGQLTLTVKASIEFRDLRGKMLATVVAHHAIVEAELAAVRRGEAA